VDNEIETVIQIMERTPGHRPPVVGAPTRCPECGEWGLVDHSDRFAATNHCYLCGHEWVVTRRAVSAVADNVTFLDDLSGALYAPEPIPLRSRIHHPSNATTPTLDLTDAEPARQPLLRLAFSNGRRVHPVGA
jgi:hypothetical protein